MEDLQEEIRQLRVRLDLLTQERDILKKQVEECKQTMLDASDQLRGPRVSER